MELIYFSKDVYYTKLRNEVSGPGESFTKLSYSALHFICLYGILYFFDAFYYDSFIELTS
jgi:hypothetical protein